MKLDGKVALVTGAARGIGWEIVQWLAQAGARVSLCDLVQADVDAAAASLALRSEQVLAVRADVTSERDVAELFQRTLDKFSRLDVLVNNAGFAWPRGGPVNLALADTPLDVWLKVLDTNLTGTFLCSREALKIMRVQGGGTIINISSPQGKKGKLLRGPYSAAKFGVEGLTSGVGAGECAVQHSRELSRSRRHRRHRGDKKYSRQSWRAHAQSGDRPGLRGVSGRG